MSLKIIRALPELVDNGIITQETAQNITAYYNAQLTKSPNKLFVVFGIIGATLVGLGIILIMAHNWDDFPRFVKLILAFLPMLLGQTVLGYSIVKEKSMVWKEAATVFLFFSVGACIALVSQIYNIPGDLQSFLLAWIVLCLPLLYVTKSKAALFLHLIFCTQFVLVSRYAYISDFMSLLYFPLMLAIVPRYLEIIRSKTTSAAAYVLHWLIPISLMLALPICIDDNFRIGYLLYMCLFGIFFNIGQLPYFKNKLTIQNGYKSLGSLGTVILLIGLSFYDAWDYNGREMSLTMLEVITTSSILISACISLLINLKYQKLLETDIFQSIFIIFGIIFLLGIAAPATATIFINVLVFALGILKIKNGADNYNLGSLNYGMFIVAALIICRFYDTEVSFAIRGLIFLLIGIGFFITNYIMLKKQQTQQS
jgi:uncharacterized membrane protein